MRTATKKKKPESAFWPVDDLGWISRSEISTLQWEFELKVYSVKGLLCVDLDELHAAIEQRDRLKLAGETK